MTKLRNEIYVICQSHAPIFIRVRFLEDITPLRIQKDLVIKIMKSPWDTGSNEKVNSICEYGRPCVWKIAAETIDRRRIMKWLDTDYQPMTLSVSGDGRFSMGNDQTPNLIIYGQDEERSRSIPLPNDSKFPLHADETSIGNFIISRSEKEEDEDDEEEEAEAFFEEHKYEECLERKEGKGGSSWRRRVTKLIVGELSRDGCMFIRRFNLSFH